MKVAEPRSPQPQQSTEQRAHQVLPAFLGPRAANDTFADPAAGRYFLSLTFRRLKANFAGAAKELRVTAKKTDGSDVAFHAICRIDTPQEVLYYLNGGILPYVLRQLLGK